MRRTFRGELAVDKVFQHEVVRQGRDLENRESAGHCQRASLAGCERTSMYIIPSTHAIVSAIEQAQRLQWKEQRKWIPRASWGYRNARRNAGQRGGESCMQPDSMTMAFCLFICIRGRVQVQVQVETQISSVSPAQTNLSIQQEDS